MTIAGSRQDFVEDYGRKWKDSLRPLSPGRLTEDQDQGKKKPGRSNSVGSSRRTRSRSVSPSRLLASTVSSRAKERDAIRFEYKKRKKETLPAKRTRPKSVSPSRVPTVRDQRASSVPKRSDDDDSNRKPQIWAAPSVLSWSGTPDREYSAPSKYKSNETSVNEENGLNFRQQNINMDNNRQERRERVQTHSYEQNSGVEKMEKAITKQKMSKKNIVEGERLHKKEIDIRETRNDKRGEKVEKKQKPMKGSNFSDDTRRERDIKDWNVYPQTEENNQSVENGISIPVKNYKTQRQAASLPSTKSRSYNNETNQKQRRKSLSTYSKTSTASRSYAGCVIA